jgi:hypothetical protein
MSIGALDNLKAIQGQAQLHQTASRFGVLHH